MSASTAEGTLHPADVRQAIIAGWTGRDAARVEAHVRELRGRGDHEAAADSDALPPLSPSASTTGTEITVIGPATSGEVECLLVSRPDGLWAGLGSDHTDRAPSGRASRKSKQVCQKPDRVLTIVAAQRRLPSVGQALRAPLVHPGRRQAHTVPGGNGGGDASPGRAREGNSLHAADRSRSVPQCSAAPSRHFRRFNRPRASRPNCTTRCSAARFAHEYTVHDRVEQALIR